MDERGLDETLPNSDKFVTEKTSIDVSLVWFRYHQNRDKVHTDRYTMTGFIGHRPDQ